MSRQAWIETSALIECISEYGTKCSFDTFQGLTINDISTLSNLMNQISVASVGFLNDPRTPLQAMSCEFVNFISTADRHAYMLQKNWFDSDVAPNVTTDNFIATYIKPRFSRTVSDVLRQVNNFALQPMENPKLISRQLGVLKAYDIPYSTPINPMDVARSSANVVGNVSQRRALSTPLIQGARNVTFIVSESDKIIFGTRSLNPIAPGNFQINVPPWYSDLNVVDARIYFTNSFLGCTIQNVQVNAVNGNDPVATITVPTDNNPFIVDSDSVVSLSLSGGAINVTTAVNLTGYAIAIEGKFNMQMNASPSYYTLSSLTIQTSVIDDFGLSAFLEPFRIRLRASGQTEIFSQSMNTLTENLIRQYMPANQAVNIAFVSPWYRFSERARTILTFNQPLLPFASRKLIIRHLWVIMSFIAVFGRYYTVN
uniref:Outer capsid protein P8 n=1 Tax=Rice gall dwarf virus TaxID=10986 RepID=Q2I127_RGDV|nr:outer capsid protein P8 [Rice gall dwarf virus]